MFKSNFTKSGLFFHSLLIVLSITVFILFLLQGRGGEHLGQLNLVNVVIMICMIVNFGIMRYKQGRKMIGIFYLGVSLIPVICLMMFIHHL
ncbi:hypothetical protein [Rossellomorea sp. YZS02]|uniref:hypothetical protein n=1 Tax=Rossellomorea sp. YZS02 TaxID=3097358 RepID=UPI002A0AAFBD|nr:hypothetical protein [Rossellomorea sp. YZS02]MDX8344982.1 hypothetical protein [Rossellomorea sp. YZS02]